MLPPRDVTARGGGSRRLGGGEFLHFLQGAHLDSDAGRLGLEGGLLTGEGIDALACLAGRLLHCGDLHQAGQRELTDRTLFDAALNQGFQLGEYIANLLEQRKRKLPAPGALHVTRSEDLLELEIETPDINIYNDTIPENGESI